MNWKEALNDSGIVLQHSGQQMRNIICQSPILRGYFSPVRLYRYKYCLFLSMVFCLLSIVLGMTFGSAHRFYFPGLELLITHYRFLEFHPLIICVLTLIFIFIFMITLDITGWYMDIYGYIYIPVGIQWPACSEIIRTQHHIFWKIQPLWSLRKTPVHIYIYIHTYMCGIGEDTMYYLYLYIYQR